MGKYFNVTVKPTIDVAALAAGNINNGNVLFDWAGFDVPKGAARLVGITTLYRGKNGADYTPKDFELFWAKGEKYPNSNGVFTPITLGDDAAAVDTPGWFHLIQGKTYIDADRGTNDGDLIYGNVVTAQIVSGGSADTATITREASENGLVLQGEPDSGTNVGYDKLYVSSVAKGTHNWGPSTMLVSTETATSTPVVVVKTLSALITLGPGDVLKDEDDLALGTVKTVDSATQITLEANCASVSAVDKIVYNTTPITLMLSFEK
jgi:hypothetical protein